MTDRIRSSISRAPIAAVAVIVGYLVGRCCASPRFVVSTVTTGHEIGAYVLDHWTGRLRLYIVGDEIEIRSIRDQEREKSEARAKRKARILERAARTKTDDGTPAVRCFQTSVRYEANVVPIDYLDDYLDEYPDAVPAGPPNKE